MCSCCSRAALLRYHQLSIIAFSSRREGRSNTMFRLQLLSYFGTASFLFQGLTAFALMKLRHDLPDLQRPFRISFYPFAPVFVICATTYELLCFYFDMLSAILSCVALVLAKWMLMIAGTLSYHRSSLTRYQRALHVGSCCWVFLSMYFMSGSGNRGHRNYSRLLVDNGARISSFLVCLDDIAQRA